MTHPHLHTPQTKPATGARVRLKTWADRVGKTLAFLRLDLRDDATGRLLAVGKHCKYLPMGVPFWDAAFNPGLYPILRCAVLSLFWWNRVGGWAWVSPEIYPYHLLLIHWCTATRSLT